MTIRELHLTQVRGIEKAPFFFEPGMNLLVGVNGAGKSTALDALRILLSHVVRGLNDSRVTLERFEPKDLMAGRDFLTARVVGEVEETPFSFLIHRTFEESTPDTSRTGEVRGQTHSTPDREEWQAAVPGAPADLAALRQTLEGREGTPLAVYFGPERSVINRKRGGGGAHAGALSSRQLRLREIAEWWRAKDQLADEYAKEGREEEARREKAQLDALERAIGAFLEGQYHNLRAEGNEASLVIDKDGEQLDVAQLSDGERGVLALVLDLTRRLALANPRLENPASQGSAVVLIDEIDLHLHPGWQREVVVRLRDTFPNCQFICTTHSPQAISEVHPDGVQYLVWEDDEVVVTKRAQSYGLDTNWILEFLMGVAVEPTETAKLTGRIEDAMDEGDFASAHKVLDELKKKMGGDSGKIARLEGSLLSLEALADEDDSEE